jgi:glycosyltransferase involved in cell wall biosynthesis
MRWPVTYWTGIWEPGREALSKEVAWLRRELSPGSPVVAFSPQPTALLIGERVLRINARRWVLLRSAAATIEWTGSVTHMFGGVDAAHFLHVLGRRPILFTVAIPGRPLEPALYGKVGRFVAESGAIAADLASAGISADRIELIHPAVNLARYAPHPAPQGRFRVLFASTPSNLLEMDSRGIGLLIELARVRPDIEVLVLWRQWGRVDEARQLIESRRPPANFRVEQRDAVDMPEVYRSAHATVCCFEAGIGKSAPNSVVEGLAAGRPALVTDTCGIGALIAHWGAGVVTLRTVEGLARGVDDLRRSYDDASARARRLAESEFDDVQARRRYADLYRVLSDSA